MHSLAAAQQQVVVSVSRASLSLFRSSSTCGLNLVSFSPGNLFSVTGLRIREVQNCRNLCAKIEHGGLRIGVIRSMASKKDRREEAKDEPGTFKPDLASLKSGIAKRFPEEASSFSYEWDSDDEEGDVQIKSFAGRRSPKEISYSSAPSSSSSTGYNNREGYQTRNSGGRSSTGGSFQSRYEGKREGNQMRNTGESRSTRGSLESRDEDNRRWAPRSSGSNAGDAEVRSFSGGRGDSSSSSDPSSRNRDAYERRMNGGKPVAAAAREPESGLTSGRGQASRSGGNGRTENTGGRNVRSSANPGTARSFRDDKNGASGYKPDYDRTGRREWAEEVEKKKKPVVEPVDFTTPMSKEPHVAILGGGMSGLVCALTLEELGIRSTVFDTGKHGLGGRMGTRSVVQRGDQTLEFDHAAQFFTVTDPQFQKLVDRWISEGAVKEWKGSIGNLQPGGKFSELPAAKRYVGTNGMRFLADHMVSQARSIDVKRPCWISRMTAQHGRWVLCENNKPQGEFDAVVIAHNGKCANRLLAPAGVPHIARQMKRLELSSIWALLAAFEEPLPSVNFEGAFVDGVSSLSWMGNNSAKLQIPNKKSPQCWTFFSTGVYGKKNKVPQESIPHAKAEKVTKDMLVGVETALGLPESSLPAPIYSRLQLWGAALPTNTPEIPCIFDAQGRVGICGDWLLGSSLEAAALSGMALAEHIAKYRDEGNQNPQDFNMGLQHLYNRVEGHDIGQFPGTAESPKESSQEALALA